MTRRPVAGWFAPAGPRASPTPQIGGSAVQDPLISRKASRFSESVIRGMSIEALKYDAVNLAQGMPDFPAPQVLKDAACRRSRMTSISTRSRGARSELRHAIAEHAAWHLGLKVDPETEITVTCGSTEAMLVALIALINPGDEVILSQPFYENYWPDCVLAGATPRFVPVRPPHWKFDPDELAAAFNDRTKAIVLCNPNNPTGAVFTREDLEAVAALCRKWDVIAITDEIYEHIIYDGRSHVTIAALDGMAERSVVIGGMSKTYAVTGWRIGTIMAPASLTQSFRQIHDFVSIGAAAPLQQAGAVAYRLPRDYYIRLAADYQARRDRLCSTLWNVGFEFDAPEGAYYIMAGNSAHSASMTMWSLPATWSGRSAWPRFQAPASSRTRPWGDSTSASASASETRPSTPRRERLQALRVIV